MISCHILNLPNFTSYFLIFTIVINLFKTINIIYPKKLKIFIKFLNIAFEFIEK